MPAGDDPGRAVAARWNNQSPPLVPSTTTDIPLLEAMSCRGLAIYPFPNRWLLRRVCTVLVTEPDVASPGDDRNSLFISKTVSLRAAGVRAVPPLG